MRIPVTWTDHLGAAPTYTIDATWMAQVVQTAQWAVDAGFYAFVNTHHDADGQWVGFPASEAQALPYTSQHKLLPIHHSILVDSWVG